MCVYILTDPMFSNAFHESTLPSIIASLVDNSDDSNDGELTELLDSISGKLALDSIPLPTEDTQ